MANAIQTFELYFPVAKFDDAEDGSLIVSGVLSTEDVDAQGEVVPAAFIRKAIADYMKKPALREMHQPIAAGRTLSVNVDENNVTRVETKVVDKGTIQKVRDGVLRGFSIGGKWLRDGTNKLTGLVLKEISLVDLPCNPKATFDVVKFDKSTEPANEPIKTNDMSNLFAKLAGVSEDSSEETIVKAFTAKFTPPAAPDLSGIVAKLDALKADDIAKMITEFTAVKTELAANKNGNEANERMSIIRKMDDEGKCPVNPATNVAFTADELQKLDKMVLGLLYANAPAVPLHRKSILKVDTGAANPLKDLHGAALVDAVNKLRFPTLAAIQASRG